MKSVAIGWRRVLLAIGAVVSLILAVAGVGHDRWRSWSAPASMPPSPPANPAIGALGRIEPESEIINLGTGLTDRLESLVVHRGDAVTHGEILGYLQSHAEEVAQRDQIAAELDEAKTRLATETELGLARADDATVKLKTILEVGPLKIEAQIKTIDSQKAKIENDRDIQNSLEQLARHNFASRRSDDDQKSMVAQEEATLAAAEVQLEQLRRQYDMDRQEGESQVRLAKAMLERAKADIPIGSLTAQLVLAEERVRRTTITAPIEGTILNVIAHPGELVGGDKTVLTMGDTRRMRAVAEVYETDIGRVRLGQGAVITSRALDHPVTGKVTEIGDIIFKNDVLNVDPAARADARVVEVRIELDDPARVAGLTNLTVDVLIGGGEPSVPSVGLVGQAGR